MTDAAEQVRETLNLAGDAIGTDDSGRPVLLGVACGDCTAKLFPPTDVCPDCMSENMARCALSTSGTLYSWSVVHAAPKGWNVPYVAGYVDLPEGVRVFAHIVDCDPAALAMDMAVTLCVRELGVDETGAAVTSYAFAPAFEGEK
ncbi:MAG: Zn-ribbon domain-containing OB-fold protein [Alphaproteobacteria bacterium]